MLALVAHFLQFFEVVDEFVHVCIIAHFLLKRILVGDAKGKQDAVVNQVGRIAAGFGQAALRHIPGALLVEIELGEQLSLPGLTRSGFLDDGNHVGPHFLQEEAQGVEQAGVGTCAHIDYYLKSLFKSLPKSKVICSGLCWSTSRDS